MGERLRRPYRRPPPCVGAILSKNAELRACYVAPEAARKGVGSALVLELEQVAREQGMAYLELDSSLTAEPFYVAHGYEVRGHGEHIRAS